MKLKKKYIDVLELKNKENFYKVYDDNFIEILPKVWYNITVWSKWLKDNDFYKIQLWKNIDLTIKSNEAWWIFEKMPRWTRNFVKYEIEYLKKVIIKFPFKKVAIDIAWWCGTYTFELAKIYDLVIHCDLWDKSINYAYHKAKELWINNILFIRCDYFNLPIQKNIADLIISIDSFDYYSVNDDIKILKDCQKILNNNWIIFCDLHNKKWIFDNPNIHEYNKIEINIIRDSFKIIKIIKFCNIPAKLFIFYFFRKIEKIFFFIPFVRWILLIKK